LPLRLTKETINDRIKVMKNILYLSEHPIEQESLELNLNLNTFNWLATNFGLQMKSIRHGNISQEQLPYLLKQIEEAHGFFLPNAAFISDITINNAILEKVKKGSILFAYANYKHEKGLEFFEKFGLEVSSIKATPDKDRMPSNSSDPQRFIVIDKDAHCFMDEQLFNNVSKLEVNFTYGLGCFGISKPVLSIPFNYIYLVDDRTDRLVDVAPEANLTIMASIRQQDWLGQIFVTTSNFLLSDSFESLNTGKKIKCIEAFNNKVFAKNLLSLFSNGLGDNCYDWNDLNRFFRDIELGVAGITREVLRKKYSDCWVSQGIPENIISKVREVKAGLRDEQIFENLNFVQFKAIWKSNWESFSWLLEDEDPPVKKDLAFIQSINDKRSLVVHGPRNIDMPIPPQNIANELLAARSLVKRMQDRMKNALPR
jgi:hypothetical protein